MTDKTSTMTAEQIAERLTDYLGTLDGLERKLFLDACTVLTRHYGYQFAAEATARAEKAEMENARLREYLQFYAYHEHWMAHASDDDYRTVLVAHKGNVGGNHGWCAAEQALRESKS